MSVRLSVCLCVGRRGQNTFVVVVVVEIVSLIRLIRKIQEKLHELTIYFVCHLVCVCVCMCAFPCFLGTKVATLFAFRRGGDKTFDE